MSEAKRNTLRYEIIIAVGNFKRLSLSFNPSPRSKKQDTTMIDSSPHLTWTNVFIGLLFVIFDSVLSIVLGLGIASSLLIAAVRCIIQLSVMGLVLDKVFASNNIWGVVGIAGELIKSNGSRGERFSLASRNQKKSRVRWRRITLKKRMSFSFSSSAQCPGCYRGHV